MKTKFFVMNEGRLVFDGSEAELRASQDAYIRKVREILAYAGFEQSKMVAVARWGDGGGRRWRFWASWFFYWPARTACSRARPISTPTLTTRPRSPMAAQVTLNGITVGKVTHVDLSGRDKPGRIIKVKMQIEDEYLKSIPVDSQAVITAGNLLGAKYINIKKGQSQQSGRQRRRNSQPEPDHHRRFRAAGQYGADGLAGHRHQGGRHRGRCASPAKARSASCWRTKRCTTKRWASSMAYRKPPIRSTR